MGAGAGAGVGEGAGVAGGVTGGGLVLGPPTPPPPPLQAASHIEPEMTAEICVDGRDRPSSILRMNAPMKGDVTGSPSRRRRLVSEAAPAQKPEIGNLR